MDKKIETRNTPESLKDALCKNHEEPVGIWVWNTPAIFFENRSRNVTEQMFIGTKGLMKSLLWVHKSAQRRMEKRIRIDIKHGDRELFLDTPTDCIMMSLEDSKTHKPRSNDSLYENFNFLQDETSDLVMIPVAYRKDNNVLEVGSNKTKMFYHDHPLELGFAFTI